MGDCTGLEQERMHWSRLLEIKWIAYGLREDEVFVQDDE